MCMQGIYKILNLQTDKVYIGKSVNIEKRVKRHFTLLKSNKHLNTHLQNSYNLYGEHSFEVSVLEEVLDESLLNDREKYWIKQYRSDSVEFGYNKTLGGDGGNSYISYKTEEEKAKIYQKISKAHKGNKNPNFNKSCYTDGSDIKYLTQEEIPYYENLGWYKGVPDSTKLREHFANLGKNNGFYGKKHSEVSKSKQSNSKLGNKNPNYGKHIYHKDLEQVYISTSEIPYYESLGWKPGVSNSTKEKLSNSHKGKTRTQPNKTAKIYIYESQIFYGWRRLRKHLQTCGYPKISECAIVKLSKGKHVRNYEELFNKIKVVLPGMSKSDFI